VISNALSQHGSVVALTTANGLLKIAGDLSMRLAVTAAVSCVFIGSLAAAEYASASITQPTDIPAESLDNALKALAHDRNLQLIYATDDVGAQRSQGAAGNLSTREALKQLLKDTGLSYQFLDDNTVTVQPVAGIYRDPEAEKGARDSGGRSGSLVQELRLAQTGQGASQSASTVGNDVQSASVASVSQSGLEEILVTAQKTGEAERLRDVPVPISVISAQDLLETNKVQLQDYFDQIPGLMVAQSGSGGGSAVSIVALPPARTTVRQ